MPIRQKVTRSEVTHLPSESILRLIALASANHFPTLGKTSPTSPCLGFEAACTGPRLRFNAWSSLDFITIEYLRNAKVLTNNFYML